MSKTTQLHVSRFDPDLKARLIEEAEKQGASLNDYAVGVLADRFKVKFNPGGGGGKGSSASVMNAALVLPVPVPLYNRIHQATLQQPKGKKSIVAVVDEVFRRHFAALDADRGDLAAQALGA